MVFEKVVFLICKSSPWNDLFRQLLGFGTEKYTVHVHNSHYIVNRNKHHRTNHGLVASYDIQAGNKCVWSNQTQSACSPYTAGKISSWCKMSTNGPQANNSVGSEKSKKKQYNIKHTQSNIYLMQGDYHQPEQTHLD